MNVVVHTSPCPVTRPVSRHEEATVAAGPQGELWLPAASILLTLQESSEPTGRSLNALMWQTAILPPLSPLRTLCH